MLMMAVTVRAHGFHGNFQLKSSSFLIF